MATSGKFMNHKMTSGGHLGRLLFLQVMAVQFEEIFFQHDGASLHTTNAILDALNENFGNCVILNHFPGHIFYGQPFPPYLHNLNCCDYILWGYKKENVYKIKLTHNC
jgi:hypothetical protein